MNSKKYHWTMIFLSYIPCFFVFKEYIFLYLSVTAIFGLLVIGYDYESNNWSWRFVKEELRGDKIPLAWLLLGGCFLMVVAIVTSKAIEKRKNRG